MQVISDFTEFADKLSTRLKGPLPGAKAHEMMRATPIGSLKPRFENSKPPRPGSVLILLYPHHESISFPLELRPDYGGAHSGQVSLPGGKTEGNETPVETALRECEEEIGVQSADITVIGRLSEFFVIPSNFLVVPVVAICKKRPVFKPDPKEVAKIIEANVEDLLRIDAVKEKEIIAARQFRMHAPYFEIDREIVWGATAMMLNEFRMILEEIMG